MSGGKPSSKRKGVEEYEDASVNTEVELHVEHDAIFHDHVPIVSYYNDRITPLLDAVDRLRQLQVVKEGIQLPTIVVVGDQSSGKSSVLESLALPLIMRLKHHPSLVPEIFLQFNDKTVPTDEAHIADAIMKKNGVPDLTLVDLPGITRVPVHGQPANIYEQIANIIMKYISPAESVILNVLSASVDFSTCESIMMSQKVDKNGERTLGLGYVCVRNRIGNESYEDARKEEAALFATHQLLSMIDKSTVGIQVLAQKLVRIQANIIAKCLPDISLRKILVRGEIDEYPRKKDIHGTARLVEMLNQFSKDFMMKEIEVLEETKGIQLPNILPHTAILTILQQKVEEISELPIRFVEEVWTYIDGVVISVLDRHSENYHRLQLFIRRVAHKLVAKMKDRSIDWVTEIVQMEKETDYTCNPEYMKEWNKLIAQQHTVIEDIMQRGRLYLVNIEGFGDVEVGHLMVYKLILPKAFDLKMRVFAYWKVVLMRLVDNMALHLQLSIRNLLYKEMEKEIFNELVDTAGDVIEGMLEEPPSVANKRERLNTSIKLLRESKEVLANIRDKIECGDL
ncbi:hypothetical protein NC653_031510 [Populus alba x Populus x berolinensis]|uniref:GED domain-containing protein n=1 Tax=Populus alba x Populus x berolinensis TaxID=444605 RepID=A0AAD6LYN7_9ROSI|nr:hypothetical protein NC653_031510 [Populus alba x Populus x berolinensis]